MRAFLVNCREMHRLAPHQSSAAASKANRSPPVASASKAPQCLRKETIDYQPHQASLQATDTPARARLIIDAK